MSIDFDSLKQIDLVSFIDDQYTKLKKSNGYFTGLCPLHNENTPSFRVYPDNNFKCYGCGEHGDIVNFVRSYYKVDTSKAVEIINGGTFKKKEKKDIKRIDPYSEIEILNEDPPLFIGEDGKTSEVLNPKTGEFKKYTPSHVFEYRTRSGKFYCYTIRINLSNGKKITPSISWCMKDGVKLFSMHKGHEMPPMYNEQFIGDYKKIIICDGEKTSNAINSIYSRFGVLAINCQRGWEFNLKQDLSILNDRDVLIIPDQSDDEYEIARRICNAIKIVKPKSIKAIKRDESKPKGWDLADAIYDENWKKQDVDSWIGKRLVRVTRT